MGIQKSQGRRRELFVFDNSSSIGWPSHQSAPVRAEKNLLDGVLGMTGGVVTIDLAEPPATSSHSRGSELKKNVSLAGDS